MNVIALLEFELAYFNSAVHRFNYYTTRTPLVYLHAWLLLLVVVVVKDFY